MVEVFLSDGGRFVYDQDKLQSWKCLPPMALTQPGEDGNNSQVNPSHSQFEGRISSQNIKGSQAGKDDLSSLIEMLSSLPDLESAKKQNVQQVNHSRLVEMQDQI